MFVKTGVEDVGQIIDMDHLIGKANVYEKLKNKCKSIIAKFTSLRYRTKAYRQKNLVDGVSVHVDLTKKQQSGKQMIQ